MARMQAPPRPRASRLRPHAKTHKSLWSPGGRSSAAPSASAARSWAKPKCSPTPGIADIRLPYPLNPGERAAGAGADGARRGVVHRRPSRRGARLVRRDGRRPHARRAREGGRRLPSLRHRAGRRRRRVRAGGRRAARPASPRALSHAGHGYHASRTRNCARMAARKRRRSPALRERAARAGIAIDEITVGATPTLRFTPADGHHRVAARQLRVLRSHAGGAGRRDARRLCADGAGHGGVEPAADRIILDCGSKTLTNDRRAASRRRRATARFCGDRRGARARRRTLTSSGCRRSTRRCASPAHAAQAGRSRAGRAKPLLCRLEPGGRGAARRWRPLHRDDDCCSPRPHFIAGLCLARLPGRRAGEGRSGTPTSVRGGRGPRIAVDRVRDRSQGPGARR